MEQFKHAGQLLFQGNIIHPPAAPPRPAHMRGCARAGLICYSLLDAARPKESLLILLPTWPRVDPEAASGFIPRKKKKKKKQTCTR